MVFRPGTYESHMTRFVALLGLLLLPLGPAVAAPIRVTGSDLLVDALREDLGKFAKANDLDVSFDMKGSRIGLETLQRDGADFGLLAFGPGDPEPGPEFTSRVVGYFTTVLVVPAELPLAQLTYSQLAGIYGVSEAANHKRWSDVGVTGPWGVRGITVVSTTRQTGLAIDLFRFQVLKNPEFKPTVLMFDDPAKALDRLRGEDGGIGLFRVPPADTGYFKVLLVAKGAGDVAYGPTSENLHSGDYPLRLPVYLVMRKGSAQRLNFVLRHLLSDEATPAFMKGGLMPLPVQARNQLVFDLETL